MLIECLLKRVGGSDISFGQNVLRQVVYKFRPVDEKDNTSPHLCDIDNKDHINRLLSIRPKAYVEYVEGQGAQFEDEDFEKAEPTGDVDDYSDSMLATINPDTVSNRYVEGFARQVLNVNPKDKKAISVIYKQNTGKDLKATMSATAMVRECLRCLVNDAKDALDIAKANAKASE